MIITVMNRRGRHSLSLHGILTKWRLALRQKRALRRLDDMPDYLLRDMGLEHLTRAERYRFGQDYWR